jgi:hypothetical protein
MEDYQNHNADLLIYLNELQHIIFYKLERKHDPFSINEASLSSALHASLNPLFLFFIQSPKAFSANLVTAITIYTQFQCNPPIRISGGKLDITRFLLFFFLFFNFIVLCTVVSIWL